jgi:hypothetical protein
MVSFKELHCDSLTPSSGKYVGSRPIQIKKATAGVAAVDIGEKKAKKLEKDLKKRLKEGTAMRFQRGGGTVAQQVGTSYIRVSFSFLFLIKLTLFQR